MPNIREFTNKAVSLQPSEIGVNARLQGARRAGAFFNQAGEAVRTVGDMEGRMAASTIRDVGEVAVDYAQHQEISHGAVAFANLNDQLTQQWNDIAKSADPNDPTVAQKFRETVLEPQLEKYRDSFMTEGGQKFAEARVDVLRNHMFEKTSADMATLAATAVSTNIRTAANTMSNTANSDPSSVPHLLESVDSSVGAMIAASPNLKGAAASKARMEIAEKTKEQIVKAGAFGAIQNSSDPEGTAAAWSAKYPSYINGAEVTQLAKYAKAQQRANLLTEKQLALYQKQQAADAAHTALSKNWTDSVSFDDNGKATIKPDFYKNVMAIEQKYPGAATERSRSMINWAQAEQGRETKVTTDPTTQSALYDGLFNPDKPTTDTEILSAAAQHKLDAHDTSTLLALSRSLAESPLKGPIYQATMQGVKAILGDGERGHENYAKFVQQFIPEYLKQQRAGTLPPNALDLKDDKSLISQKLAPWKLTPQQKMMDHLAKGIPGFNMAELVTALNPGAKTTPTVTTKDDYDKLPRGAVFIGSDGKTYRKP